MRVGWIVLTDGRQQYIKESIPTWVKYIDNQVNRKIILDDSGDDDYRSWLSEYFPSFNIIPVGTERQGYDKAMQKIFSLVKDYNIDYCLHTEDDFILHKAFFIQDLMYVLAQNKRVAQMSLMRQPWYHNEHENGGVIEAIKAHTPSAKFIEKNTNDILWTEHSAYWTCNPNIFPKWLTNFKWPDGAWSESRFSKEIFKTGRTAGIFGAQKDWPYVEHIGRERYGNQY
jgi:hypothetical protein